MKIANFERLIVLPLTKKENKSYYKQKLYYICKNKFNIKIHRKIQDHYRFTGKYRYPAHLICNLRCRNTMKFP